MFRSILLGLSFALAACGPGSLGVRSVDFALTPAPATALPQGLDPAIQAAFARASATLHVDAVAQHGIATAVGLPVLPDGWRYGLVVALAPTERSGLPGPSSPEGTGHAHGALGVTSAQGGLFAFDLGAPTVSGASTAWHFGASQVAGHGLGALREATLLLVGPMGELHDVLHGELSLEGAAGGETPAAGGGHEHGA